MLFMWFTKIIVLLWLHYMGMARTPLVITRVSSAVYIVHVIHDNDYHV